MVTISMPSQLAAIQVAADELRFRMSCDEQTGTFLRTLARSKSHGQLLEIGTGAGVSTCWLLDGMDESATLTSIDTDAQAQTIAQQYLGNDQRISFRCMDGGDFIRECVADHVYFDLIFADSWPGKFFCLEETLSLLNSGGIYIVDDLHTKPHWSASHQTKVTTFIASILARDDLITTQLDWSTGLMMSVKK
jgi:predicted O-methyltransferase YrrM